MAQLHHFFKLQTMKKLQPVWWGVCVRVCACLHDKRLRLTSPIVLSERAYEHTDVDIGSCAL